MHIRVWLSFGIFTAVTRIIQTLHSEKWLKKKKKNDTIKNILGRFCSLNKYFVVLLSVTFVLIIELGIDFFYVPIWNRMCSIRKVFVRKEIKAMPRILSHFLKGTATFLVHICNTPADKAKMKKVEVELNVYFISQFIVSPPLDKAWNLALLAPTVKKFYLWLWVAVTFHDNLFLFSTFYFFILIYINMHLFMVLFMMFVHRP